MTSADWSTGLLDQVLAPGTDGTDPSHRKAPRRATRTLWETTHCDGVMADIGPHQLENNSVSSFIAMQVVVWMIARRNERAYVNSVWNHIGTVECPRNPGWKPCKGAGKGKHKGKRGVFGCAPGQGAKRLLDTGVESVKVDSKKIVSCVPAIGCFPREGSSGGRRTWKGGPFLCWLVCGTLLEIVERKSSLVQETCQRGLSVHPLSGGVACGRTFGRHQSKRGEMDWLNVVPSTNLFALDRVPTKMLKLCRVAHRKGIWWSVQLGSNPLWSCRGVECLLQLEGAWARVHQAPFWRPLMRWLMSSSRL